MRSNSAEQAAEVSDAVVAEFCAVLAGFTAHATGSGPGVAGGVRVDRIALLERMKAAVAAAQHVEMVAFARDQVEEHLALVGVGGLDPAAVGRGVADQIALACRVSPHQGSRRLGIARAPIRAGSGWDRPGCARLHGGEAVVAAVVHGPGRRAARRW